MSTAQNPSGAPAGSKALLPDPPKATRLHVVRHYDLLYWWVVWLYAGVAWLLSNPAPLGRGIRVYMVEIVDGKVPQGIIDGALKTYNFYPDPLLGIGFIATLMFVVVFIALRARGVLSAVLVLVILIAGATLYYLGLHRVIIDAFPRLRVHMNQGFYGAVFVVLFPLWLLSTFVFNRFHYYMFAHGKQIGDMHRLGGGTKTFLAHNVSIHKLPDDIFVHRILGLWWLGFGTGDIEISFVDASGSTQKWVIHNVWNADRRISQIRERVA